MTDTNAPVAAGEPVDDVDPETAPVEGALSQADGDDEGPNS